MIRVAFLAAALVLPALAQAEQVWRWEDAAGRLHYSNVAARVPSYAEPVRTTIGRIGGTLPPGEARLAEPAAPPVRPDGMRARRMAADGECRGCYTPLGYPFVLFNHGVPLADQVKQAHLLDALHVPWRQGFCQ